MSTARRVSDVLEHALMDEPGAFDLVAAHALDANALLVERLDCGLDDLAIDGVEVDLVAARPILLLAARHDD
jgi:hypothetical protein